MELWTWFCCLEAFVEVRSGIVLGPLGSVSENPWEDSLVSRALGALGALPSLGASGILGGPWDLVAGALWSFCRTLVGIIGCFADLTAKNVHDAWPQLVWLPMDYWP